MSSHVNARGLCHCARGNHGRQSSWGYARRDLDGELLYYTKHMTVIRWSLPDASEAY
jgi:hypothetical protein